MSIVYLVGAGPGDPGLLTLRAARLLRRADIVVHDALVSDAILARINRAAERIDVGKRAGGTAVPQAVINHLLIQCARRARLVLRLKGGDPFVFGRGGEEAEALAAAGVRFRVVPGVTAAIGAAAYAGIPLTQRDVASSFTLLTGHEAAARQQRVDWSYWARSGGTLAIYMGLGALPEIAQQLLAHGRDADTPCAVISCATTARQRIVTASLAAIAGAVADAKLEPPALIVIGDVVAIRERIAWFERVKQRALHRQHVALPSGEAASVRELAPLR